MTVFLFLGRLPHIRTCAICVPCACRYLQVHLILTCFSDDSGTNKGGGTPYAHMVRNVAASANIQQKQFVFNKTSAVCSTENS